MWYCVTESVFPNVLNEHGAFIFKGSGFQEEYQMQEIGVDL
jgi:hypothetical protein